MVLGNGRLLDQVLKRSGILPRTVHKEPGTTLRRKMLLEFAESGHPVFRATTPSSRGTLKAKGEENCLYNSPQMKIQLIRFIALFFLSISSVSTEQWQLYAKNLRTIKIDQGNLRF